MPQKLQVYRLLKSGAVVPFVQLEFLGGATLERDSDDEGRVTLYDGLPPYMNFAAPSGFLGKQLAHELAPMHDFPQSLSEWRDEHRITYLFTHGLNLPGNLVFGNASLQMDLELRKARPTPVREKSLAYLDMASALKGSVYGLGAGGEQPKFLWLTEDAGHVIVKFAKLGSRMAELLPLEHLALRSLGEVGVPAARTQLLIAGDYVFLEVQRFDRVGLNGRVGMLSAGAVDDEFFGKRDSWSEFAARCVAAKSLSAEDARHVHTMAAFSELIGNGDRHFENLSLLIDERGEYQGIAPAYDILPMRYASIGGGVDPDLRPIEPKVGPIGARPEVWERAARAAQRFWTAAQTETLAAPLSDEMKALAAENLTAVWEFVAPLVPAHSAAAIGGR
ncbi:HipA domain-containing protein [Roseateles sp. UC29_93]|uniref:HipA domain-containing protein n=1 Tax=Roseateles sp. UC29_93 TaxID=3350177 RepID=UPI00366BCD39